jgi:uncharacterized phage protein (TIGR01671 family)
MREIKFRGKRKNGSELFIGDLNHINGKVYILPRTEDTPLNGPDWFEVDEETVGQYTGRKDKNGKEIYEGDIVKTGTDKNMVIGWSDRFASFVINRDGWAFQHWFGEACDSSDCEVIGNIHQNPELIQVKG